MKNWIFRTGAVLLVAAAGGATALAQTAPVAPKPPATSTEPAQTTATYGDWVLGCSRSGEGAAAANSCVVVHTVQPQQQQGPQGQQRLSAQIAIGGTAGGAPMMLTVVLPVAISFNKAPQLATSGSSQQVLKLAWRRCVPRGCFAEGVITPDFVKVFRSSAEPLLLGYQNAADKDVVLPVSLNGLPLALDNLAKEVAKK